MKKIVITGASGLLGWHSHAQLHAANCAAKFKGNPLPYEVMALNHADFDSDVKLQSALVGADSILHYAGVNRGLDGDIASGNPEIATRLVDACKLCKVRPHIIYANSIHSSHDSVYGRSKRMAGEVLQAYSSNYTDLILPHIFGECAQPFYNNVTATFIHQIIRGDAVSLNPDGHVQLFYAGDAARLAINALKFNKIGRLMPKSYSVTVPDLFAKLKVFDTSYKSNIYPDLSNAFDLALFNSYRCATYPDQWPRPLQLNTDQRGTLFEAVKGGSGGQTFLSTTKPGITRGDHFHLNKVERFVVIQGDAIIRVRKVLSQKVIEYRVSGRSPVCLDMPTLHTHSIENIGDNELLTLFWTNDIFDPTNTDTFADKVLL